LLTADSYTRLEKGEVSKAQSKIQRNISIFLLFGILASMSFAIQTAAASVSDVNAPVLHEIWVSPSAVEAGETVKLYANVTDDLSEVEFVNSNAISPSGEHLYGFGLGYNQTSGLWEGELSIPEFSEAGIWTFYNIHCGDTVYNYANYMGGTDFDVTFTVMPTIHVIPESPVGTIMLVISMIIALVTFIEVRKTRANACGQAQTPH